VARKTYPGRTVFFMPVDFSFSVRSAYRRIKPDVVVLVELEVWPNFMRMAERRGVSVVVINGRISGRSYSRYRRLRRFFRPAFGRLKAAGVQDDAIARRFRHLGCDASRVTVTGNLKYDSLETVDTAVADREVRGWFGLDDAPILLGGSTHDPEEGMLLDAYASLKLRHPRLRLLLAPRHAHRVDEIVNLVEGRGGRCYKRSLFPARPGPEDVLLLDTVGELARAYAAAAVVYLGGTFADRGGQNPLEAAAAAKAIVSGPDLRNFSEMAAALEGAGGLTIVPQPALLAAALDGFLKDPARAAESGRRAHAVLKSRRGALKASVELVHQALEQAPGVGEG
jgi:3-deoxy-D-manno-octulosonic-acid transferase